MNSLPNCARLALHTKHMHPLERTRSTRFCLLHHGKRVRRVVVRCSPEGSGKGDGHARSRSSFLRALVRCNDGQMVRSVQVTCSCTTVNPSVREVEPLRNKASTEGTRMFGCRPRNSPLHSRDARDVESCPVGREHGRNRSRVTGQSLVGAVKGDQNTDGHFDIDSDFCVTSQPYFPDREDGAVALASRAQ